MFRKITRIAMALVIGTAFFSLSLFIMEIGMHLPREIKWTVAGLVTIITALLGFTIAPFIINKIIQMTEWLEVKLQKTPIYDIKAC